MRIRDTLRSLRRLPERMLHRWRRRAALGQLTEASMPEMVLVVCYGNICRSPYAAAKLRGLLRERQEQQVRVDSAGFVSPHRESPTEAVEVASARGFDLRRHRSRVITLESARRANLIVVMEPGQAREVQSRFGVPRERLLVLGDLDPQPIVTRVIRDPVLQSRAVFAESYDRIDRCLTVMVDAVWKSLSGRRGSPDGDMGKQQPPQS